MLKKQIFFKSEFDIIGIAIFTLLFFLKINNKFINNFFAIDKLNKFWIFLKKERILTLMHIYLYFLLFLPKAKKMIKVKKILNIDEDNLSI